MDDFYNFEKIFSILDNLEIFQQSRIPLCAAENVISKFCKLPLDGDIQERYIMGNYYTYSEKNNFVGSQYLVPIYEQIHNVCNLLFDTKYTDARTLSGMNCITTLLMSLTHNGDKIAILSSASGGHPSILPVCERLGLHVFELPYDYINFDLNYEETNYIIEAEKIPYILLAPSDIIKPMDIQNLMLDNSILLYDISQIMGLISGKQINNPLKISSNIVLLGGTHKTLPGPASGIIMTNNEEIHQTIEKNINPKYLRHTQMHQVISLLFALIESKVYGQEYARNIISTSNILGKILEQKGFQMLHPQEYYSNTHQLFIKCSLNEMNQIYYNALKYGVTLNTKEKKLFSNTGIRLGTQEIARYGWKEDALEILGEILCEIRAAIPNASYIDHIKQKLPPKKVMYTFPDDVIDNLKSHLHKK